MPTVSTLSATFNPIQQSLAALHAGQESFAQFVVDLFGDLEAMQQKLLNVQAELCEERGKLAEERQRFSEQNNKPPVGSETDESLQSKVAELEQDRAALEEELEGVRARAVGMAQTLAEQKRQMAEEHAEWSAELRQLRRTLDKQASWISQHAEIGAASYGSGDPYLPQTASTNGFAAGTAPGHNGRGHPTYFPNAASAPAPRLADPVVGSILSQFELLQKDVARRREQLVRPTNQKDSA